MKNKFWIFLGLLAACTALFLEPLKTLRANSTASMDPRDSFNVDLSNVTTQQANEMENPNPPLVNFNTISDEPAVLNGTTGAAIGQGKFMFGVGPYNMRKMGARSGGPMGPGPGPSNPPPTVTPTNTPTSTPTNPPPTYPPSYAPTYVPTATPSGSPAASPSGSGDGSSSPEPSGT